MKPTNQAKGLCRCAAALALAGTTILTASAADYPTTVLSKSPLAYWRLDETSASPPLNIVTNYGTAGSAGNGYVVLDVIKGEPGVVGTSIRLNNPGLTIGHSGSKVDVPYNSAISRNFPFSIEFWAKPNALPASDATGVCPICCFDNNWYGAANRSGWLFYVNNTGRWNFRLGLTSGYAVNLIGTGTSGNAAAGTWQHIVATYDGLTANLYANGVLIGTFASDASTSGWLPNMQSVLRIGGSELNGDLSLNPSPNFANATGVGHSGNRGWDGWIDEVAVYPTVLDTNTIAAHYSAGSTNSAGYGALVLASNPAGYWNMDEPVVTDPDPSTFPILNNLGTLGAAANGTNMWGGLTAQPGSGYGGLGATNQAIFLDGENGYISLQDAPGLHFTGKITLMAWVKPIEQDYYRDIIAHGWDPTISAEAETFLRISRGAGGSGAGDGNYYEVGVTDDASYYDDVLFPIPAADIGQWVFLAGTYDGAAWNLYRNGVLVGTSPSANGAVDSLTPWSIGSRSLPSPAEGLRFGGWIDEPAIFNTALTASDINAIYNAALVPPVITQAPQPRSSPVYEGSTVAFSVWAEGSPTLSYTWYHNSSVISGQTGTNLTLTGVTVASSGIYSVVVTNAYGSVTSSVPLTVLTSPPIITQQPNSETRFNGAKFSFSVGVIGSDPLAYQWSVGGSPIGGATQSKYAGVAQASGLYSCTITNLYGSTNSTVVNLTVVPLPSGYPSAVLADSPVSYWRLGETNGSTAAHDYVGGNDGVYHAVSLGVPGYSTIDPDTAGLFGAVNTYIGAISPAGVNFSGHTNFSLEAWVKGPAGQSDESTIIAKGNGSSGTTATEQFSLDTVGGNFRILTRGGGNSIYEADATVGPNGTWQHVVGVYDDSNQQMLIYVNGQLSGSGTPRPAGLRASTDPVTIGSKHLGNDPAYDGYFTGTIDEVAVYPYALSATQVSAHYAAAYGPSLAPSIVLQPESTTNYESLTATLSASAAGTVPLYYQWNKAGVPISGATTESYTINPLALTDTGSYSVTISNAIGVTNSASAVLTVLTAPTSPPAIPGLVVHLPFDNSLTDATGRGNNGTGIHISGTSSNAAAATYVNDGVIGQGMHYSTDYSSGTNNSYVTLGLRPDLQFSSNVSFSVCYWIRPPLNYALGDLPFVSTAVGSTFNSGLVLAYTYGYGATPYPGGWAFSIYDTAGAGVGGRGAVGSINDGNWHHLVHVFDRKSGVSTYLDGIPVGYAKQAGTSFQGTGNVDTGNWFTIGQDPTGTYGEAGSGDIDDLGVFRRALTPFEAASIFMAGVSNKLSFVAGTLPTATISIGKTGGAWQITYTGVLQSSATANGPYTPVSGAVSPYTIPAGTQIQFYRTSTN